MPYNIEYARYPTIGSLDASVTGESVYAWRHIYYTVNLYELSGSKIFLLKANYEVNFLTLQHPL